MIARTNTNRNFPIPNKGGSRSGGVAFTGINLRHKVAPPSAPGIGSPTYASRSSKHIAGPFRVPTICLKIPETVSLRVAQRCLARQYFSKGPVNAVYTFGDHADELPVIIYLCSKPHGGQRVPDMMIHLCDYLHPCLNEPMTLLGEVGQLCDQAAQDES